MSDRSHNDQAAPEASSVADKIMNCFTSFQKKQKENEESFIKDFNFMFDFYKKVRSNLDEVVMFWLRLDRRKCKKPKPLNKFSAT